MRDSRAVQPQGEGTWPERAQHLEGDVVGRLERLADLHDSGALSGTEFAQAKARVLGQAADISPHLSAGDDDDGAADDLDDGLPYPDETISLRWAPWWMVAAVVGSAVLALLTLGAVDPLFQGPLAYAVALAVMTFAGLVFTYVDARETERGGVPFFGSQVVVLLVLGAWAYLLQRAYLRKGTALAHGDHWLAVPLALAAQAILASQAPAIASLTIPH